MSTPIAAQIMNICIIYIDQADTADNTAVNCVKLLFNYLVKTTGNSYG